MARTTIKQISSKTKMDPKPLSCCLDARGRSKARQVIHQFSHSRVTFSESTVAELAGTTLEGAREACSLAHDAEDIRLVSEVRDPAKGRIWQGKRRKL